jgi:hypothetical protein
MESEKHITLVVIDGTKVTVPLSVANNSKMIRNLIADVGIDNLADIPLAGVSLEVCQKVIQYMSSHQNEPDPTEDDGPCARRTDNITDQDREFANVSTQMLFELILAANYMDVKSLLDLMCKTFANTIKGKSPAQIRKFFGIEADFTAEEIEQVLKENEWARELSDVKAPAQNAPLT